MSDLVQRLRRWNIAENATRTTSSIMRDLSEAADEIERLKANPGLYATGDRSILEQNQKYKAEIERLNAELQLAWNTCDGAETKLRRANSNIAKLQAVVDACVYSYGDNADRMCALCHTLNGHEGDCPIAALKGADDD